MGDPDAAPTPEAARQLVVDAELRVCGLEGPPRRRRVRHAVHHFRQSTMRPR